jgi:hypothetical protein
VTNSGTESLLVEATAANAGATVIGGTAGATLEVTKSGTVTLASGDDNLTVKLDAASTLVLNRMEFIVADASVGNSAVTTQAAGQIVLAGTSDTVNDVNETGFTLTGTATNMDSNTIINFNALDVIDITNFYPCSSSISESISPSGTDLNISCGGEQTHLNLAGFSGRGSFIVSSDHTGGSLITYSPVS